MKRSALPRSTRMIYVVYQVLIHIALPFGVMLALWRGIKEPKHLQRWADRIGFGPVGPKGAVWFYAASLGEMNAARPLVQKFLDEGHKVLLTHLSPAGLEAGERLFGDNPAVTHRYMPLDCFWMVWLFLRRARPSCGIVLEIEVWPAMLMQADRATIPMFMANGNLLERSMKRLGSWRRHGLYLYRLFDHVFTRDQSYADRYMKVGLAQRNITLTGDLRFDTPRDAQLLDRGKALRASWNDAEFTFMISSSVHGEEDALSEVCETLLSKAKNVRIIWVPRSPQRFDGVAHMLTAQGFTVAQRSAVTNTIPKDTQIFVGNSMGEMDLYLGMADVVFVGASFVNHGGHNIIEPLTAECPVVMGPSTYGIDFAAHPAADHGVFVKFKEPSDLSEHLLGLSQDPSKLAHQQENCSRFAAQSSNAAQKCYEQIADQIAR